MVYQDELSLQTRGRQDMHDLTREVQAVVKASGIRHGIAHVFNIGSTGVVGTVEFEPGLIKDIPRSLNNIFPPDIYYFHEETWHDGNGHSHVQASVLGPDVTVPVTNGSLVLGTWQQIFHLECDIKPRHRVIKVTVIGETTP